MAVSSRPFIWLPSLTDLPLLCTDTACLTYEPTIVEAFTQPVFTDQPPNFKNDFVPQDLAKTMTAVTEELEDTTDNDIAAEHLLRDVLLAGLVDIPVGLFSVYHENAVWLKGYGDPDAVRVAYL